MKNPSITNTATPAASTQSYGVGQSSPASAPAAAAQKDVFNQDAAMKNAEMQLALGMGNMGAEQADALMEMQRAEDIGRKGGRRMDWASQASRALAGIGEGYGKYQGQKKYDASRARQGAEVDRYKRMIERLRRGENPDNEF
jgi:hypothetical protein